MAPSMVLDHRRLRNRGAQTGWRFIRTAPAGWVRVRPRLPQVAPASGRRCPATADDRRSAARGAPPPQRFNPVVHHLAVMEQTRRQATTELDLPLIQQPPEALHRRLLSPGEASLAGQQPVDLGLGDHPGAEAAEEQLTCGHWLVTNPLHAGSGAGLPWGPPADRGRGSCRGLQPLSLLTLPQTPVGAPLGHQLIMVALLHQPSTLQNQDPSAGGSR
jgi:hypothetical protein